MLVYIALALAVAFVLRRGDGPGVLGGIVLGVTVICSYALATRLVPDRLDTYDDPVTAYRLAEPLGYWNALGLLATLGALVALGLVAHSRRSIPALAAAAVIPIMVTTLYFTFSRGAWAALIVGLVVAVAVDPRRLRLLWVAFVTAIPALACIAYASRLDALTHGGLASGVSGSGGASRCGGRLRCRWCRRGCSRGQRARFRGAWTSLHALGAALDVALAASRGGVRGRCSDRRRWPSRCDRRSRGALQCRARPSVRT